MSNDKKIILFFSESFLENLSEIASENGLTRNDYVKDLIYSTVRAELNSRKSSKLSLQEKPKDSSQSELQNNVTNSQTSENIKHFEYE